MFDPVRKRLFQRIVLFEPKSGTIIDLSTRFVLSNGGPEESEEYAETTEGTKRPVRRSSVAQIPITHTEAASIAPVIRRFKCPVKCLFLGTKSSDVWAWLEPSRLQVRDPSVGGAQQAEKVLEIESNVFFPGIWEGMGVLEGVPWRGTTQQTRNGNDVLRPKASARPGYEGPLWSVPSGASVDLSGNASGIDSINPATIEIEFPAWKVDLKLFARTGTLSGGLEALDWDGNQLAGPSKELTIPEQAWFLRVTVEDTARTPFVTIQGMNDSYGVLEGKASPDCSRVASPIWNDTLLVITDEDV